MDRAQLLNDSEEAMRLVLDGRQSCIWTAMPGIVQSVDFDSMTCEVQPTIQGTIEDENGNVQYIALPLLLDVPIVFPSAGGFLITFPMAQGDEVLVVIASRCIDSWWQLGGVQKPMEARMHDLSDGFAIPGPKSQPKVVDNISTTAVQIRNDAGTSYIEIAASGLIKLSSATGIELDAPISITGTMTFDGDLEVTGAITASGEVTGNGIALSTHVHTSAAPGSPTSPPL